MRQQGPYVRTLYEAITHILFKNITYARRRRNVTPSKLSSHLPSDFTLHFISDHVSTSQSSLYYKACTKHFRILLCATKLTPRSTFYHKAWIKYFPILFCGTKLAQSILNIILYHKACTEYFPVLLSITKPAQSTYQYYFVLQSLHKKSVYTQQVL